MLTPQSQTVSGLIRDLCSEVARFDCEAWPAQVANRVLT